FWLGDTGWLLFIKCSREEAVQYLQTRKEQGFNVVQVMVLHGVSAKNEYGDSALINRDVAKPAVTKGNNFSDTAAYDFWDHVDFIVDEAAKRGIYMAMVPVWGSNVKEGKVNVQQAETYAKFLSTRYKNKSNIIWLNGGDIKGSDGLDIWKMIGSTLRKNDSRHLITFHPRGRNSSSEWFHKESWLDFNMFQSGHKTYAQDTSSNENLHFGEDNWRYVNMDYTMKPVKPTLDGEPSYENIPHGLHDSLLPRWKDTDLRRYAYWSVFAGGAGFTYGENAIMQFHTAKDKDANFGVNQNWKETIHAPGANQMQYLKKLMLSKSYFDRVPAQEIITDNVPDKYNTILATKGKNYAMVYTYNGRNFSIDFSKLKFKVSKISWFNSSDGTVVNSRDNAGNGIVEFDPPGEVENGNDWVLILE
ncbi:MAG TPA: glycoside hydrolase family 140 protein, partial [Chitinophagaceae bacterium]|nr:glycoside hydrolase family 140 protein [Chitinophagaceae bacterium]